MTSKTHNLFAFATLVTVFVQHPLAKLSVGTVLISLVANIIGALLPDIDQEGSRLWDLLPGGDILGRFLSKLFWGHRSLSHSILGAFLVYVGAEWLMPRILNGDFVDAGVVITAFLLGYGSHLLADGLTEEGLPLLFPWKKKFGFPPVRKWRIRTGKWFENYFIFPGILIYILILLAQNYQLLLAAL